MLDLLETAISERYNGGNPPAVASVSRQHKRSRLGIGQERGDSSSARASQRIRSLRFDGSMSQSQRSEAIQVFQEDSDTRILLISLK
jgi:superfamily II DNA/RNA helicase